MVRIYFYIGDQRIHIDQLQPKALAVEAKKEEILGWIYY